MFQQTGHLPRAGGLDDQPAERLRRMLFADRVRSVIAKRRAAGAKWHKVSDESERVFLRWLNRVTDGRYQADN